MRTPQDELGGQAFCAKRLRNDSGLGLKLLESRFSNEEPKEATLAQHEWKLLHDLEDLLVGTQNHKSAWQAC